MPDDEWVKVADTSDLEPDTGFESDVEINGEAVGVFELGGAYYALGACPHEQGPLSQGIIEDGTVRCPWHSAVFDIRTGRCISGPTACRIDGSVLSAELPTEEPVDPPTVFETKVEDDAIYARMVR